jgi:hypothetical protein
VGVMKIEYTIHADYKIRKLGLPYVWVEETIKLPDNFRRDGGKSIVTKKLNGITLEVVYEKEKNIKVVTCYLN